MSIVEILSSYFIYTHIILISGFYIKYLDFMPNSCFESIE